MAVLEELDWLTTGEAERNKLRTCNAMSMSMINKNIFYPFIHFMVFIYSNRSELN